MHEVERVEVAVVGAGFGGLTVARRLLDDGERDFVVLERGDDVGGVWRDNRYPGVQCDVPSHLYSLSFAPNPAWGRTFSGGDEIFAYARSVADGLDLGDRLRLNTAMTAAEWDESSNRWRITTDRGELLARVLVDTSGGLIEPRLNVLAGLESFEGKVVHTARWDENHDVTGERVAVVGTGASAIQIVPAIAQTAESVVVFQRTAPWVLPKLDRPTLGLERRLHAAAPALGRVARAGQYAVREFGYYRMIVSPRARRFGEALVRAQMRLQVPDSELRERLTPDYEIGCKRMLMSSAWYPTLARPDVEVAGGAARATRTGVIGDDGVERPVDTIIMATGFLVWDAPIAELFRGRDGRTLAEAWGQDGVRMFKGATVPGFPNLFRLGGAGTATGHMSHLQAIESQVAYVGDAIAVMRSDALAAVEVRAEATDAYQQAVDKASARTVFTVGGCRSWYMDPSGKPSAMWPGTARLFRRLTRRFDADAYRTEADESAVGQRDFLAAATETPPGGLPVRRAGHGEPLVLVHGAGADSRVWAPVVGRLTAGGREVIAVDLPGCGDAAPGPASGTAGLAARVAETADALGLGRFDVAGNSLGGWVALELARVGAVRSVCAIAPAGLWGPAERAFGRVSVSASAALVRGLRPALPLILGSPVGRTVLMSQFVAAPWRLASEDAIMLVRGLLAPGLRPLLEGAFEDALAPLVTDAAVTIGLGARDLVLPARQAAARVADLIPGARTELLPATGHLAMWDAPGPVAALMLLAAQQPAPARRSLAAAA